MAPVDPSTTSASKAKAKSVFISYSRRTSSEPAQALWEQLERLGPDDTFLDANDIRAGEDFVDKLLDSVLGAKVIVVFLDQTYLERPYCWFEYEVATRAYQTLLEGRHPEEDPEAALDHLVIARPEEFPSALAERLLGPLQEKNWVSASQTLELSTAVRQRLERNVTLAERLRNLEPDEEAMRADLQNLDLPPPQDVTDFEPSFSLPGAMPPSLGGDFKGRRQDIRRIRDEFKTTQGNAHKTVVLRGATGIGKTTLAAEYLYRYGPPNYPGGLFWVDAGQDVAPQLHGILRSLDPDTPALEAYSILNGDGQQRNLADELRTALRKLPPDRPALYVVDDVPDPPAGEGLPPLDAWCPAPEAVSLLVTTQVVQAIDGPVEVSVDPLARPDARALLTRGRKAAFRTFGREQVDEITDWVGRLPLALGLLNALLEVESPEEVLERARAPVGRLATLEGQAQRVMRGVREAFRYSYDRLPESAKRPAQLIAQLSPAVIPLKLIEPLLGPLATDPEARAWLIRRSLVTKAHNQGDLALWGSMHPLLGEFLLTVAEDGNADLSRACLAITSVMASHECRDPQTWPLLNACATHGVHVFSCIVHTPDAGPELRASAVKLGLRIGALSRAQGLLPAAEKTFSAVVEMATSVWGGDHPQTLAARSALAETWRAQGRLDDARGLQEQILAISRFSTALGPGHPETLAYQAQLAGILAAQGERQKARTLLQEVVDATAGPDAPVDRGQALSYRQDLAVLLFGLDEVEAAYDVQRAVLREAKRLGTSRRFLLRGRANLANILTVQGKPEEAEREQRRVVDDAASLLPPHHPDLSVYRTHLARILMAKGTMEMARSNREPAQAALEEASRIQLQLIETGLRGLNGRRTDRDAVLRVARLRGELATTLSYLGQLDEARDQLERGLAAFSTDDAPSGDATLLAWSLFVVLQRLGDADAAQDVFSEHLDWLLDDDPGPLEPAQEQVRAELAQLGGGAPPPH